MKGAQQRAKVGGGDARLRAIVSAVPDIIFALDGDGTYLEAFTSATELLYQDLEEVVGSRIHDVFPKTQADEFMRVVHETMRTGRSHTLVYKLDVPAGARWFEGRTAAVDPADPKTDVVFLARDITDRKAIELALREREELLETRNAELLKVLARVKTLEGLFQICAYCRRIRGKGDQWMPLETFFSTHTHAELSHGACPSCLERAMEEIDSPES